MKHKTEIDPVLIIVASHKLHILADKKFSKIFPNFLYSFKKAAYHRKKFIEEYEKVKQDFENDAQAMIVWTFEKTNIQFDADKITTNLSGIQIKPFIFELDSYLEAVKRSCDHLVSLVIQSKNISLPGKFSIGGLIGAINNKKRTPNKKMEQYLKILNNKQIIPFLKIFEIEYGQWMGKLNSVRIRFLHKNIPNEFNIAVTFITKDYTIGGVAATSIDAIDSTIKNPLRYEEEVFENFQNFVKTSIGNIDCQ